MRRTSVALVVALIVVAPVPMYADWWLVSPNEDKTDLYCEKATPPRYPPSP